MASLIVAYFLCLFGGYLGLHHLYLRRPYHAFTWTVTGGGFFGIGVLWDLWELRNYADECRSWADYIREASVGRSPRCSLIRFTGQLMVGCWLGFVTAATVPHLWWQDEYLSPVASLVAGCGVAWGVYVVGNIGIQERKFIPALVTSCSVCLITLWYFENGNGVLWAACLSALMCNKTVAWRTEEKHLSRKIYFYHCFLYFSIWCLFLYNNGEIYYEGKMQPVHVVLWRMYETFSADDFRLWSEYLRKSAIELILTDFAKVVQNLFFTHTLVNPREVDHAYETLGFTRFTKLKTVRSECRKLMKIYHPDKFHDSKGKVKAEKKFVKIQQACHLLTRETTVYD